MKNDGEYCNLKVINHNILVTLYMYMHAYCNHAVMA
jgi:hypothetical protein